MSRSPLFYPLNRGMDAEAGGAADLQTDVMRFMAIISLCLVAIFALVQSIPLAPEVPDEVADPVLPPVEPRAEPAPQVAVDDKIESVPAPPPDRTPTREPEVAIEPPRAVAALPVTPEPETPPPPAGDCARRRLHITVRGRRCTHAVGRAARCWPVRNRYRPDAANEYQSRSDDVFARAIPAAIS